MSFSMFKTQVLYRFENESNIDMPMALMADHPDSDLNDQQLARELVVEKYNRDIVDLLDEDFIDTDDVYVIWYGKTDTEWRALVSVSGTHNGYYQVTHTYKLASNYIDAFTHTSTEIITDASR